MCFTFQTRYLLFWLVSIKICNLPMWLQHIATRRSCAHFRNTLMNVRAEPVGVQVHSETPFVCQIWSLMVVTNVCTMASHKTKVPCSKLYVSCNAHPSHSKHLMYGLVWFLLFFLFLFLFLFFFFFFFFPPNCDVHTNKLLQPPAPPLHLPCPTHNI